MPLAWLVQFMLVYTVEAWSLACRVRQRFPYLGSRREMLFIPMKLLRRLAAANDDREVMRVLKKWDRWKR